MDASVSSFIPPLVCDRISTKRTETIDTDCFGNRKGSAEKRLVDGTSGLRVPLLTLSTILTFCCNYSPLFWLCWVFLGRWSISGNPVGGSVLGPTMTCRGNASASNEETRYGQGFLYLPEGNVNCGTFESVAQGNVGCLIFRLSRRFVLVIVGFGIYSSFQLISGSGS